VRPPGVFERIVGMDETPYLDALAERAMDAYNLGEDSPHAPALRRVGALVMFHGIALNGGLVGGGVENCLLSGNEQHLADAVAAYRWLGLDDAADLVERATAEYRRFQPAEGTELSDEDDALWDQLWVELDEAYFALVPDHVIEVALLTRSAELPGG